MCISELIKLLQDMQLIYGDKTLVEVEHKNKNLNIKSINGYVKKYNDGTKINMVTLNVREWRST